MRTFSLYWILAMTLVITYVEKLNRLFKHQQDPQGIIPLLKSFIDEPEKMAAGLLWLMQKGITTETIISTGLLHDFFKYSQFDLDTVKALYTLLSEHGGQELYLAAQKITCNERGFEVYALTGEYQENLTQVALVSPILNLTEEEKNISLLYEGFGMDFLQEAIHFLATNYSPVIYELVKNCLNSPEALVHLASLIALYSRYTGGKKDLLLMQCAELVDEDTLKKLLASNTVALHLLLYKPALITDLQQEDLEKLLIQITKSDQNNFEQLSQSFALFHLLKEQEDFQWLVFQKIIEISLSDPRLVSSDYQFKKTLATYNHPSASNYLQQIMDKLQQELDGVMHQQMASSFALKESTYHHIEEYWTDCLEKCIFLIQIKPINLNYPPDKSALRAAVIKKMWDLKWIFNLETVVNLMVNHYDDPVFREAQKKNTFLEILLRVNAPYLQNCALDRLVEAENWPTDTYEKVYLLQRAIDHDCTILLDHLISPLDCLNTILGSSILFTLLTRSLTQDKVNASKFLCHLALKSKITMAQIVQKINECQEDIVKFIGNDGLELDKVVSYFADTNDVSQMVRLLAYQPSESCLFLILKNAIDKNQIPIIHALLGNDKIKLNQAAKSSALHWAAMQGDLESFEFLFSSANRFDDLTMGNAIRQAQTYFSQYHNTKMLHFLCTLPKEHELSANRIADILYWAVINHEFTTIKLLCHLQSKNRPDEATLTHALDLAIENDNFAAIDFLLDLAGEYQPNQAVKEKARMKSEKQQEFSLAELHRVILNTSSDRQAAKTLGISTQHLARNVRKYSLSTIDLRFKSPSQIHKLVNGEQPSKPQENQKKRKRSAANQDFSLKKNKYEESTTLFGSNPSTFFDSDSEDQENSELINFNTLQ